MPRLAVHMFAFGSDNDEDALHGISSATRGTFTLVDNSRHHHASSSSLQDAMARCVGGLRSVTAQGVWIEVDCRCQYCPEIGVAGVMSGSYESKIASDEDAWVSVGELYADEKRPVPVLHSSTSRASTPLITRAHVSSRLDASTWTWRRGSTLPWNRERCKGPSTPAMSAEVHRVAAAGDVAARASSPAE
ncbi:hypothetical protein HU200_009891 [Digitaria exilis]|uniref:Uncharacterized protein n=1 Tax=Digitaria exilis TaxID=1010633 RepID=A0A835KNY9_9POAL|nr:hypothetical protein HU200_009891 [Digitaria exilis]